MSTLLAITPFPTQNHSLSTHLSNSPKILFNYSSISYPSKLQFQLRLLLATKSPFPRNSSINNDNEDYYPLGSVEILRVPDHWSQPSNALLESEWLRVALHKWLDDEYCPEPTNVDISRVAADSYYHSLLQKTTDLGEILLKMARELETISYQESFHGAFSSANAAVTLISEKIESDGI